MTFLDSLEYLISVESVYIVPIALQPQIGHLTTSSEQEPQSSLVNERAVSSDLVVSDATRHPLVGNALAKIPHLQCLGRNKECLSMQHSFPET